MTIQETIDLKASGLEEDRMISQERWDEIRCLRKAGETVSAIARRFDVDRKTVRSWLRKETWTPYRRGVQGEHLLETHAEFLRERAAAVDYSAQILYQELRQQREYSGSYATVRRFVRPLREAACRADLTWTRFETPPGQQSQVDWGQARVWFGAQPVVRHIFVLTLGYSRRSLYVPCLDEALGSFLDAHEIAFEYFGGHTQEHLYDRARTVCHPAEGGTRWNGTFKAFAAYWSFEPRLCQPYRAQTKGKVESGVKYFRRNFLPGRTFRDDVDFGEQLAAWTRDVADVRVHGTTHERPIERFVTEAPALVRTTGQPPFRLEEHAAVVVDRHVDGDALEAGGSRHPAPAWPARGPPSRRRRGPACDPARQVSGGHPPRAWAGPDCPDAAIPALDAGTSPTAGAGRCRGPGSRVV